jgi:CheY-like chemotaxis protein
LLHRDGSFFDPRSYAGLLMFAYGVGMAGPNKKTTILLVDDEPLLLLDFEDSLVEAGYEVLSAYSADQAIKLLNLHPDISLVVTDINMPGSMNGLELVRVIRERWPPVRLIIASSQTKFEPGDVPEGIPVLNKPFVFAHLDAVARQLLGLS